MSRISALAALLLEVLIITFYACAALVMMRGNL